MAQIKDPGKLKTNSGYVKNTNPGPDRATSSTVAPCKWAMWPKMEKTKTPAVKQVQVLTMQVMMASLKKSGKIQTVNTFHNCTFFHQILIKVIKNQYQIITRIAILNMSIINSLISS